MSSSDTMKSQKFASIAEVAAAECKLYTESARKAPEYTDLAKKFAENAEQSALNAHESAKTAANSAAGADQNASSAQSSADNALLSEQLANASANAATDSASSAAESSIRAASSAQEALGAVTKTLRVTDSDIPPLPSSAERAGKVLTCDASGNFQFTTPASGSATDVLNQLAESDGASLIGYGDQTLKDVADKVGASLLGIADFSSGGTLGSNKEFIFYDGDSSWYFWDGVFPKTVPANSTPDSSGLIGIGGWLSIGDAALRSEINNVTRYFSTVAEMVSKGGNVGQRLVTLGYYSAGDGGGAEYIVKSGTAAQDYSDAGSVQIDSTKYAWLIQKDSYNFKQFGVKADDGAFAQNNDTFITYAIKRARSSKAVLYITDIIWHKAPIVIDYWTCIKGFAIGMDSGSTPRFVKVDNTKSGLSPLGYPGVTDTVSYDVDASIIIKRQSSATDFVRGVTLEGFTLFSSNSSEYGIYAPHMADFSINLDIRGFICGLYANVIFLGRVAGRFIGVADTTTGFSNSIGVWLSSFSTITDCGNSVSFRVSLNNFCRGIQAENFANGILETVTLEKIKRSPSSSMNPYGIFLTNAWFYGEISCESSSCCILRSANNGVIGVKLSANFKVDQDSAEEGIVRVLQGGRMSLDSSVILANNQNTSVISDSGGYLDISSTSRLGNIIFNVNDTYRFKNRTLNYGQTTETGLTSYPAGSSITFNGFSGLPNAKTQSGVITFLTPALMKITVQARGISSGTANFGINNTLTESITTGQEKSIVVGVKSGDTLNITALSAITLGTTGGIRVLLEPIF